MSESKEEKVLTVLEHVKADDIELVDAPKQEKPGSASKAEVLRATMILLEAGYDVVDLAMKKNNKQCCVIC